MKKFLFILLATLPLAGLRADIDTGDVGPQNTTPYVDSQDVGSAHITPYTDLERGAFTFEVFADFVGRAKVRKWHEFNYVKFATGTVDLDFVYYYDPCLKEGASVGVAYQRTYLDWNHNPFFNERNIDSVDLVLTGFTERFCDWNWRSQISINFDNIEHWNFQDYMNYDFLLWGRYTYCENVGLHIGVLAQTGMKIDRVYPVVGFDWQYNADLKISGIFPLNISAVYTLSPEWSIALAGRFFDQRHRVKKDEFLSEGLYHYQTGGGEVAINYFPTTWLSANAHIGYDFGGTLTIWDRHHNHRHRLKLDSAPYAGAEFKMHF